MKKQLKRLESLAEQGFHLIQTQEQIVELARKIHGSQRVGFDTESYGPRHDKVNMIITSRSIPAGFSIALQSGDIYYIPVGHHRYNVPLGRCKPIFDALRNCGEVWAHNWKHDMLVCEQMGFDLSGVNMMDSMVLYWLLASPGSKGGYGLKDLAKTYLGIEPPTFYETVGDACFFGALDPREPDTIIYACLDAENTLTLAENAPVIPPQMEFEMEFMRTLYEIEKAGMGIDSSKLDILSRDCGATLSMIEASWGALFPSVSISSPAQIRNKLMNEPKTNKRGNAIVGQFFSGKLFYPKGLPVTDSGAVSINSEALKILEARYPEGSVQHKAVSLKIAYQDVQKIKSTYSSSLVDQACEYADGRLHPSYMQTGTATGRLSCSNPNLQNIPVRSKLGQQVKECFVPRPGHSFVAADYSQIELRVLAHYCGSGLLYRSYKEGVDVHQKTADAIGCDRTKGKTIAFASLYGAGPEKMGKLCGVSTSEGKRLLNNYFEANPEIVRERESIINKARADGFVSTILGRIRRLPELTEGGSKSWSGERKAFNTVIQGSAADIVKIAMINVSKKAPGVIVSQIHDEITLEVPDKFVDDAKKILQTEMEAAYDLAVPLVAEPSSGKNWGECK